MNRPHSVTTWRSVRCCPLTYAEKQTAISTDDVGTGARIILAHMQIDNQPVPTGCFPNLPIDCTVQNLVLETLIWTGVFSRESFGNSQHFEARYMTARRHQRGNSVSERELLAMHTDNKERFPNGSRNHGQAALASKKNECCVPAPMTSRD